MDTLEHDWEEDFAGLQEDWTVIERVLPLDGRANDANIIVERDGSPARSARPLDRCQRYLRAGRDRFDLALTLYDRPVAPAL